MEDPDAPLIPARILQAIYFVVHYANEATHWTDVKLEIIDQCPAELRCHFSRRHELTKRHTTNKMEYAIVEMWKDITGVELTMPEVDRTLPRISKSGRLAIHFLIKQYPRGIKELFSKDATDNRTETHQRVRT